MKLPDLRNFDLQEKRVLVRVDFDVPLRRSAPQGKLQITDDNRIKSALSTINYLLSVDAKIILLSHLGRPEGKFVPELSLGPVAESLATILQRRNIAKMEDGWQIGEEIFLRENLRFDPGEKSNDFEFTKRLASLGDFFINDAFAVSHRGHASIVGLPKLLPHAAGLSLLREVEVLSGVLEKPRRPVVVILGGAKEDKLEAIPGLLNFADNILIGGKLPSMMQQSTINNQQSTKIVIGTLNEEGKDITLETAEKFIVIIEKAGTILWAGSMGQYEGCPPAGGWELGTREIGRAVADSSAFKIVGGGDTEAALSKFNLKDKIDFISSGGGAMLELLASGDLVGLKALRE